MRLSSVLALLLVTAAGVFAYMNQNILYDSQTVVVPGGSVPLTLGTIVVIAVGAVALVWLAGLTDAAVEGAGRRSAERRLADREREVAEIKARALDDTARKIDELSRRMDEHWGREPIAAQGAEQDQTTVWRRTGEPGQARTEAGSVRSTK